MHLERAQVPSLALTFALLLSGQTTQSSEDFWGRVTGRQDDRSGQRFDYGMPAADPYDRGPRFDWAPADYADQFQEPSWVDGDRPFPGRDGLGFRDDWQRPPAARGQVGPHGAERISSGVYPDYRAERHFDASPSWARPPDYRQGYGDYAFRPWGESEGASSAPGPIMGPAVDSRGGPHLRDAYPGYRFRGDPPGYAGSGSSEPHDMGYRFRPWTDQEQRRFDPGIERWSGYPRGYGTSPLRGDPGFEPEAAYGFEPSPWRGQ